MSLEPTAVPLTAHALDGLDPAVDVPGYDRAALAPSIVHIGVGGFHRSHLATYVHELCQRGSPDWSIVGAGVLPGDVAVADALDAQDCLYTLVTRGATETHVEVIGSIVDYVRAWSSPDPLIAAIAAPATQIVSLTVTEGGYPIDDVTGRFAPEAAAAGPESAFAVLAAGLDQRRRSGGAPVTVMSCDNIMSNGRATRISALGLASHLDAELAGWIESNVAFPNSMVDRITPATTDRDRAWLADHHGLIDRCPVVAEPFRQWVIEDAFAGARLPVDELDVIVTTDVEPYEIMKLRLLNAGHSCLAYLAALIDIGTVDQAMADDHIRRFVVAFLDDESKPVVPVVAGIDLDAYTSSLVERFSNPAIGDQIARLCLDGSAKFPKFLLPTIRAQLGRDGSVALGALALAGWCHYLAGTTESSGAIEHAADPNLHDGLDHAGAAAGDPRAFLAWAQVFGSDLPASERFVAAFSVALERLRSDGVRSTIETTLREVAGGS